MLLRHDFIQQAAGGLITTLATSRGLAGRMRRTMNKREHNAMSRMRTSLASLALAVGIITVGTPISLIGDPARFAMQSRGSARLILIVVMDGLRPDSINREDTPTLFRLRQEGVSYVNSHSVFPTVTRVNAAAISTGTYPDVNGLVSNSMFVPRVHPTRPFNTSD